jgi:hypothetical protein
MNVKLSKTPPFTNPPNVMGKFQTQRTERKLSPNLFRNNKNKSRDQRLLNKRGVSEKPNE